MKKSTIFKNSVAAVVLAALTAGCSEDFLVPEPLSFFEPTVTFSKESGLQAAMAMCDRHLRVNYIWYNDRSNDNPLGSEYMFSDYMVYGKTDNANGLRDIVSKTTPNGAGDDGGFIHGGFWGEAYGGIKYANGVIANIPNVTDLDQATKDEYLGRAYFHRAYRYYNLIFEFGDVPLVTQVLTVPKQNYRSTKKEAIIKKMIEDLEFAVEKVPVQAQTKYYGMVNKEACKHLLVKFYLADNRFADAERLATDLIENSGLALMKEPFGTDTRGSQGEARTWEIERNVIWDLHRPENKIGSFNTECILGMPNLSDQSFVRYQSNRIFGPFWNDGGGKTPDNLQAIRNTARSDKASYDPTCDWIRVLGRGIATYRPTYYVQHSMWVVNGKEDTQDLRHNSEVGNWINMTDLTYNNKESQYHGQHLRLAKEGAQPNENGTYAIADILYPDTIRSWFDFPYYKYYTFDIQDEANENATNFNGVSKGANGNLYLFRLAETYLLRAEARLYQGRPEDAAKDLNELRQRAKCSQFYTTCNIGDIMNERGRELYMEELRHAEMVRVSMIMANNHIPDEWGNTYDPATWDKQEGTDKDGGSYWYQRMIHYSFYNRGEIQSGNRTFNYVIGKHNLYWPIPQGQIDANKKGQLKQNFGYNGYDPSVAVWDNWQDAVADESKTE